MNGKTVSCVPHEIFVPFGAFRIVAVYLSPRLLTGTYLHVAMLYFTHLPAVSATTVFLAPELAVLEEAPTASATTTTAATRAPRRFNFVPFTRDPLFAL